MYGDETGGNRESVRRAARVEILRRLPNLKTIDGQLVKREEIEAAENARRAELLQRMEEDAMKRRKLLEERQKTEKDMKNN